MVRHRPDPRGPPPGVGCGCFGNRRQRSPARSPRPSGPAIPSNNRGWTCCGPSDCRPANPRRRQSRPPVGACSKLPPTNGTPSTTSVSSGSPMAIAKEHAMPGRALSRTSRTHGPSAHWRTLPASPAERSERLVTAHHLQPDLRELTIETLKALLTADRPTEALDLISTLSPADRAHGRIRLQRRGRPGNRRHRRGPPPPRRRHHHRQPARGRSLTGPPLARRAPRPAGPARVRLPHVRKLIPELGEQRAAAPGGEPLHAVFRHAAPCATNAL